jgi:hypothetical protein
LTKRLFPNVLANLGVILLTCAHSARDKMEMWQKKYPFTIAIYPLSIVVHIFYYGSDHRSKQVRIEGGPPPFGRKFREDPPLFCQLPCKVKKNDKYCQIIALKRKIAQKMLIDAQNHEKRTKMGPNNVFG